MNDKNENKCGCGRSPTGKCIGWHALSEEKYKEKLAIYNNKKKEKNEWTKSNKTRYFKCFKPNVK